MEDKKHTIFEKKVAGIWRVADIYSSSQSYIESIMSTHYFSRARVFSYEPLTLPKFILERVKKTTIINLEGGDIEQLKASFKKSTRLDIKYSFERYSNLVFRSDVPATTDIYKMYASFEVLQGRKPVPFSFFKTLRLFVAYLDDEPISMVSCLKTYPIIKVFAITSKRIISTNKELYKTIGVASKRIIYNICDVGIKEGAKGIDLAYVNFDDSSKKGITNFKMSFGGDVVTEYQYVCMSRFWKWLKLIKNYVRAK
jgi:hypothetical protein